MSQTQALDRQVGGDHYKHLAIQPAEYSYKNKLSSLEAGIVKYITRWKLKGGFEDLDKIIHLVELIKQFETEMGHHWREGE